jgi:hypothetical protein
MVLIRADHPWVRDPELGDMNVVFNQMPKRFGSSNESEYDKCEMFGVFNVVRFSSELIVKNMRPPVVDAKVWCPEADCEANDALVEWVSACVDPASNHGNNEDICYNSPDQKEELVSGKVRFEQVLIKP